MDNKVICEKCGKEASLVGNNLVCHICKRFISKKMEIYSRVVGYYRPIQQWNPGKQEEFKNRKEFIIS